MSVAFFLVAIVHLNAGLVLGFFFLPITLHGIKDLYQKIDISCIFLFNNILFRISGTEKNIG